MFLKIQACLKRALSAVVVMIVAFLLVAGNVGKLPLNEDEETSLHIASGFGFHYTDIHHAHNMLPLARQPFTSAGYWQRSTPQNVYRYTLEDNGNCVAYNYLYFAVIHLFGYSVVTARLISVFCFAIAAALLYLLAIRVWKAQAAALLVSLVFLAQPFVLHNMVIARSYGFSLLLVVLGICLFAYLLTGKKVDKYAVFILPGFTVLSLVMTLTHYFNAVFVAFNYIFLAVIFFRKPGYIKWWLLSGVLYCLGMYAWFFQLHAIDGLAMVGNLKQYMLRGDNMYSSIIIKNPVDVVYPTMCAVATVCGFQTQPDGSLRSFVVIAFLALPVLLTIAAFKKERGAQKKVLIYLLSAIVAYVLFSVGSSIKSGNMLILYRFRFWIVLTPFVALLIGFSMYSVLAGLAKGQYLRRWLPVRMNMPYCPEANTGGQVYIGLPGKLFLAGSAAFLLLRYAFNIAVFAGSVFKAPAMDKSNLLVSKGLFAVQEPYEVAADTISNQYKPGDTVVYKNWRIAQNINLYLRNNTEIIQRTDTTALHDIAIIEKDNTLLWHTHISYHPNIYGAN